MKNQNEKSGKRGRPVNPNSPRQQRLNQLAQRVANGETVKRGRPSKTTKAPYPKSKIFLGTENVAMDENVDILPATILIKQS